MAGRKQHYLPQHLLRGFEASKVGKKTQVVVYKKGARPYVTSTEGVASQRDFYSKPGDGVTDTLDDLITAFEGSTFNPFLDQARLATPDELLSAESAATAVVHLTVRASHLRGAFALLMQKMLTQLDDLLSDPEVVRKLVDIDSTNPQSLLSEEIKKVFDPLPIEVFPEKERAILEKMARFKAREKFDVQMGEFTPVLREQLSILGGELPRMVVLGHTKVLEQSLVPVPRLEALRRLHWRVFSAESPSHFVLPDCAAIASTVSGRIQPVAMSSDEEISWVAMPIGARQVLIGYTGSEPPVVSNLNEHFVKCSLEFFVSSIFHADLEVATSHMGEVLEALTVDLMEESFVSARLGCGESATEASTSGIRIVPVIIHSTEGKSTDISRSIQRVVAQQCDVREANRLESIVVTDDVCIEVARLYGRELSPYEEAVKMGGTIELVPDTVPSSFRMFLPERVVRTTGAADVRMSQWATVLVTHLLGQMSYFIYWLEHIVPMSEGHVFTLRQRIALELTHRFSSHYCGSVKTAQAANESELREEDEHLSVHAVTAALGAIEVARQQFIVHQSVDALLPDVVPALDILLGTLAKYCGRYLSDAESRRLSRTTPTAEYLVRVGLWEWLNLFGPELHRHRKSMERKSSSIEQVLALSEHVERVLWQYGIFLSDVEDGRLWVDACDEERLGAVRSVLNS